MLRWQHRWGKYLKVWQERYDKGGEPPLQFYERPEVEFHLHPHWTAFSELSTERSFGMGVGPIPRSKIVAYATDELELVGEEHERFCAVLLRVDADYTSMANSTDKTKGKNDPTTEVSADDADGVRGLFKGIAARKKAAEAQKKNKLKS